MVRMLVKNMTIKHNGEIYPPGSVIELDEAAAQELSRYLAPAESEDSASAESKGSVSEDESEHEQLTQPKQEKNNNGTRRKP